MVSAPLPVNATSRAQAEPNSTESRLLSLMDDMRSLRLFVKEEINDVDSHLKQRKTSNQRSSSKLRHDDETTTTMTPDLSRTSSSSSSNHTGTEQRKRRPTFVSVQRQPSEGSLESPVPRRSTLLSAQRPTAEGHREVSPVLSSESAYTAEPTAASYCKIKNKASPIATKRPTLSSSRHVSEPTIHRRSNVQQLSPTLLQPTVKISSTRRTRVDDDLPQPNKPLRREDSAKGLHHEAPAKPLRRDVSTRALDHSTAHLQESLMKMANLLLAKTVTDVYDDTCDDTFCTLDDTDYGQDLPLDMYMKKESASIPSSSATKVGVRSVCSDLESLDQSAQVSISKVGKSHHRSPSSRSLLGQISINSSDVDSSQDRSVLPLVSKPRKERQRRQSDSRSQQSQPNERRRHVETSRRHQASLETTAYPAEQDVIRDSSKRAKATSVRVSQRRFNSQRNLNKARDSSSQKSVGESVADSKKTLDNESGWADFEGSRFRQSWHPTATIEPAAAKKDSGKSWYREEDASFPEDSMSDWKAGSFAADFLAPVSSRSPRRSTKRGLKQEQLQRSFSSTNQKPPVALPTKVRHARRVSKDDATLFGIVSLGNDDDLHCPGGVDAFGFLNACSDSHSESGKTMLLDFSARSDSVATAPANGSVCSSVAYEVDAMMNSYVLPSVASRSVTGEASAFSIGGDASSRASLFDVSMPADVLRSPGKKPAGRQRQEEEMEETRPTLTKLFAENPAVETAIDNMSLLMSDLGSHDGTCIDMVVEDSNSVGSVSALTYIVPSYPWQTAIKGPLTNTAPLKSSPRACKDNKNFEKLTQMESFPENKEVVRDLQHLKSSMVQLQRIDLTLRKAILDKEDEVSVNKKGMRNLKRILTMEEIILRKMNEKRNASKLRLKSMELNVGPAAMDPQSTSHAFLLAEKRKVLIDLHASIGKIDTMLEI